MNAADPPIILDGGHLEGGGALLRTALVMSALTLQPVRINSVRAGTKFPGVNPEDRTILRALALMCAAEIQGGEVGDTTLEFRPKRKPRGLNERIDICDGLDGPGSANALVILGTLSPVLTKTGVYCQVAAQGETYGHRVLSYDYFASVTQGAFRRLGLYTYSELNQAGFGWGSRGEVSMEVEPSALQGMNWTERGKLIECGATIVTAELLDAVERRALEHFDRLASSAGIDVKAEAVRVKSKSPGAFVTLWAEFERGFGGATAMGAKGLRMEAVVQNAFDQFLTWYRSDATVDPFLADQLLLPAVLADGPTTFRTSKLTLRFLTIAWVIKQFLPIHITVHGRENEPGMVIVSRGS